MPHVLFLPLTGFRVRELEMLELGMSLPGLRKRGEAVAALPALGPLTLAGMLPAHWSCGYRPVRAVTDEIIETVIDERPDLVAISALTASIGEAYRMSDRLRQAGVRVVMGGLHVTACPDEARMHCDAIVVGEAEPVWLRLLAELEQGDLAPVYRADRDGSAGGDGLREWPLPRFDLVGRSPQRFTLQTQRGCPLGCEFCAASRLLGRFREKPVAAIRRELEAIAALAPRPLIELADDNTFAGSRPAEELCDALAESGARWFTESDWRIGERPELLARLAQSGCAQVLVGIESLVFRYPGQGRKLAELNRILDAVQAIQEAGVAVNGCFIVGADGETRASLDRLTRFLLDSPFAELQVTLETPFPGTALYRRLRNAGRLIPDRGWEHYTLFDVVHRPDRMAVEELEAGFRELLRTVFSPGATERRNRIRREIRRRAARLNSTAEDCIMNK